MKMPRAPLRDKLDTDSSRLVPVGTAPPPTRRDIPAAMVRLDRRDKAAPPAGMAPRRIRLAIPCREVTAVMANPVPPVHREGMAGTVILGLLEHPVVMASMVHLGPEATANLVLPRREALASTVLRGDTARAVRMILRRMRLQGLRRVDTERPVGRPATIPWAREAAEPARHRRWSRRIRCIPWCSWC